MSRSPEQLPPEDKRRSDIIAGDDTRDGNPADTVVNAQGIADLDCSAEEAGDARLALAFLAEVKDALKASGAASQESSGLPAMIGRYQIERSLGRGGFAEVFLARDEMLNRQVALKVPLISGPAHSEYRVRFEREARAAALLAHPAIVPVYEYDSLGPLAFIAYRYIDGTDLATWLRKNPGPMNCRDAARVVARLADAMEHAHQRGLIHRDLKPSNIMIDRGQDSVSSPVWERVLVTDFGLVRQQRPEQFLTHSGIAVGTPAYMSPEQATGSSALGATTDVYSLGVILYELLTGKVPFAGGSALATLQAVQSQVVPPISQSNPRVPGDLQAICLKSLAKLPGDRYGSCFELATDLNRWLEGLPVTARLPSRLELAGRWIKRNPWLAASLALAFCSLVAGLSVSLWQRNQALASLSLANKQTKVAQEQTTLAQQETHRANSNLQIAQSMISDIANLEKELRHQADFGELRGQVVARAAELQLALMENEPGTPQLRHDGAMTLRELSPLLIQLGQLDAAEQNIRRVLQLLEGIEDELPPGKTADGIFATRIGQRLNLVAIYQQQQRYAEAIALCQANYDEALPDTMPPHRIQTILAENMRGQAGLMRLMGDLEGAVEAQLRGLEHLASVTFPDDQRSQWDYLLTTCRLNLGLADDLCNLKRIDESVGRLETAETNVPSLFAIFPDSPFAFEVEGTLGLVGGRLHRARDEAELAVDMFRRAKSAIGKQMEANPAVSPSLAESYLEASAGLVEMLTRLGRDAEARAIAREALARHSGLPPSDSVSPDVHEQLRELELMASGQDQ